VADAAGGNNADADLDTLAFVTSAWPNPQVREIVQIPQQNRTSLEITVINNSRHSSPDGGITLSFPDFTRPSDRERIEGVDVPEGMALHLIPAGGDLFGRNGAQRVARHLMIEVHGAWNPREVRTLRLDVLRTQTPVLVKYRSALADESGEYRNTPTDSPALDQQGWPALSCLLGGQATGLVQQPRTGVQALESGGRQ